MRGAKPYSIVGGSSPVTELPQAPDWLSADACAEWDRLVPVLITERKTLTTADLGTLTSYCVAMGQIVECSRRIQTDGLFVDTKTGLKKHPAVAMRDSATTQARLLAAELGLTPVSRSRRGGGGGGGGDGFVAGSLFDPQFFSGGH